MFDRPRLKSIELRGFKSFDSMGQEIEPGPVTVLLGANGAGKSNLVSFFRMLGAITAGGLQNYVASQGFADSLLHLGPKATSEIRAKLKFEAAPGATDYSLALERDATGRLFFKDETVVCRAEGSLSPRIRRLGGGFRESRLGEAPDDEDGACQAVHELLSGCRVFHFHDTSTTAKVRSEGYLDDARFLRSDAGNLAAFLRGLRNRKSGERYYHRIVRHIRTLIPSFEDFDLEPSPENERYVRLNWREKGSDYLFGPHQLSDGALRFMALTTLFLQPPDSRPRVVVVDEPELGLHPAALTALAGMAKAAPPATQVILATQSPRLIDEFQANRIVIVERDAKRPRTILRRLNEEDLGEWLESYCLSDLWEKNVLGGRP